MTEERTSKKRKSYKGIIIDLDHAAEINDAIAAAEENRKARLIGEVYGDGYKIVAKAVEKIEKKYSNLAKATLEGCIWRYDHNHQDFPETYKYVPESTQITVTYAGGKWRLLKVSREVSMPKAYSFVAVQLTDEMKKAIIQMNKKF